jgi:membrane protease YdiL (CAAX protease family)
VARVTEEVLLRWGVMSWLLWLAWRVLQRGAGPPRLSAAGTAIVLTALLFGLGHLPAAYTLLGRLDADTVLFVVGANTLFGLAFGALYWRRGLEAAMLAHATTHLVAFLLDGLAA